jgi:hypothetical protein
MLLPVTSEILARAQTHHFFCQCPPMQLLYFAAIPLRHSLRLRSKHTLGGPTRKNPSYSSFHSRLCHYSVGGAWWHLLFLLIVGTISPATGVNSEGENMAE